MDDADPQDEADEYQEDADDGDEYQEDADDADEDQEDADDADEDQEDADIADEYQDEVDVADEYQDEADVADEYQDETDDDTDQDEANEADGLPRRPDRRLVIRLATCYSSAVRVEDPGPPDHSQFHLFPSTPAHYRCNTCRPTDFPRIKELDRGWVGVPHDRSHAPIPVPNRSRLSPREAGIKTEPLYAIWQAHFQYLQQWAVTHPFFTGYPPALSLTSLRVLWDLSLGNVRKKELIIRECYWPYQAVEDWAVINTVTQCTTVSGLQLTQGIDVLVCTSAPCPLNIAPTFYGLREWESVSLNGLELYTSRPQYPPSSPPVLRWAQRERNEREKPLPLPPPNIQEMALGREIHMLLAQKKGFYQAVARSRSVRPGQDEDLA